MAVSRDWRTLAAQFMRFGTVGALGVVVDGAALTLALHLGLGPYGGRLVSYLVAATTNWALNRAWTFRGAATDGVGRAAQWGRFILVNLVGFVLNYGTYALLLAGAPAVRAQPVIGVAVGAVVGMVGNFLLSRRYVFGAA